MKTEHGYRVEIEWTGARGAGTTGYRDYGRDHTVSADDKLHDILGSSDRAFRGEADRWNPEELLLAALAQCHMLSYLHVATTNGVVVTAYDDDASGTMREDGRGGGAFTEVTLRPRVEVADPATVDLAQSLHARAAELCFIGASVNFPVHHEPETFTAQDQPSRDGSHSA